MLKNMPNKVFWATGACLTATVLIGCGTDFTSGNDNTGGGDKPTDPMIVFDGNLNSNWEYYDCCGGGSIVTTSDSMKGNVLKFSIIDGETTVGLEAGSVVDHSEIESEGTIDFSMKIERMPTESDDYKWSFTLRSLGDEQVMISIEQSDMDATGVWYDFSFPLSELANEGLNTSTIDRISMTPSWGKGTGAVYYMTDIIFTDGSGSSEPGDEDDHALLTISDESNGWSVYTSSENGRAFFEDSGDLGYANAVKYEISGAENAGMIAQGIEYFDGSEHVDEGVLSFDLKVLTEAVDPESLWEMKVRSNADSAEEVVYVNLIDMSKDQAEPVVGEWVNYTFNLSDLGDEGVDLSAIDRVAIYPTYGKGDGAVYYVANVSFYAEGAFVHDPIDPDPAPELVHKITDGDDANIFAIDGNSYYWSEETVRFLLTGTGAQAVFKIPDAPLDVSAINNEGVLTFDLRLRVDSTALSDPSDWVIRFDPTSGWEDAVVLSLLDSDEGSLPVRDEWVSYTIDLSKFESAGLDLSDLSRFYVYPVAGEAAGINYDISYVHFYDSKVLINNN
ncbi:hypothetical protein VIN01S_06940 [Vibrio inusitatus NBRC 102082]|uniref:Uncharacterized protein n=1 Tax=Vibrio inusitatus NBRC 102082 TaxID=1219070 RepID=A0A4Y3HT12_9VIBR|nr:hypothetical protein [Vibrio inusitatus]GEA49890.1 hypothetical protein VIN01S_06940 [Vibrio inusitatus NBRC 102082]